jgi:hypothetical protein
MLPTALWTSPRVWLGGVLLAAFLALTIGYRVRGVEIRALTAEKAELKISLVTIGDALEDQNERVAKLAKASDAQAVAVRKATQAASQALGAAKARAEALTHVAIPAACPAALEWLRDQVLTDESSRSTR